VRRLVFAVLISLGLLAAAVPVGSDGFAGAGPSAPGANASATVAAIEEGIRNCANRNRRARGLAPLASGVPLNRAAQLHAANMARRGFFDHTDPQGRGPSERVAIFDRGDRFHLVGENIGAGYDSAAAACRGWMGSPGHRRNVLNPDYTHIGGGFAHGGAYGRYYVQVLAALRR
jgi:uncharacterized protein YkwD